MRTFVAIRRDCSQYGTEGNWQTVLIRLDAIVAIDIDQSHITLEGNHNINHIDKQDLNHVLELLADDPDVRMDW